MSDLCPNCNYPEGPDQAYRGIYTPGKPCDYCGVVTEPPPPAYLENQPVRFQMPEGVHGDGWICGMTTLMGRLVWVVRVRLIEGLPNDQRLSYSCLILPDQMLAPL